VDIENIQRGYLLRRHYGCAHHLSDRGHEPADIHNSPIVLTDAIEQLLHPLAKLHLPVHELAMMMTIALRFIPTLIEETDKIMDAQRRAARSWIPAICASV
jgi:hypothetical protein